MRPIGWSLSILTALGLGLALSACGDARPAIGGGGGGGSLCAGCHGTAGRTGFLSGTDPDLAAAPPVVPVGTPASAEGLHQLHVNPAVAGAIRSPLACSECHVVPTDTSHATNPPANPVVFGVLATAQGALPAYSPTPTPGCSATYCHGSFSYGTVLGNGSNPLSWTATAAPSCTNCHGLPPSGHIPLAGTVTPATCAECHPQTVNADGSINVATGAHINGQKDVQVSGCTACHGTAGRTGNLPGTDPNLAAAPPVAPAGAPAAVVGAHQAHLNPAATGSLTGPLACSECHVVPTDFSHATNPPAQIVQFGPLATASANPATPTWNGIATPNCSSVYCHGSFQWSGNGQGGTDVIGNLANAPDWTLGSGQAACGTCHDLPPTNHIQNASIVTNDAKTCAGCHPKTVNADGSINVATGAHVNGQIDEGAHADPNWVTASGGDHTAAALSQNPPFASCLACHVNFGAADPNDVAGSSCNACHGAQLTGAQVTNWQQNCVFCHGDKTKLLTYAAADQTSDPWIIAPPTGAQGETLTTSIAVGAHQQHANPTTNTLSTAFLCSECHTPSLPPDILQTDHLSADGSVPVLLAGSIATTGGVQGSFAAPSCSATYCHGNYPQGGNAATPAWTTVDGSFATCTSCHGAPPSTGEHAFHVTTTGFNCSVCHNGIATGSGASIPVTNGAIVGKSLHVNGVRDVVFSLAGATWTPAPTAGNAAGGTCSNVACHGAVPNSRPW